MTQWPIAVLFCYEKMESVVGITFVDKSQNFDFEKSGKNSRPRREKWSMLLSVPFLFRKWNNFSRALIALWMTKHTEKLNSIKTLNFDFFFKISLDYTTARKIFTVSSLSADTVNIGRAGMGTNR